MKGWALFVVAGCVIGFAALVWELEGSSLYAHHSASYQWGGR